MLEELMLQKKVWAVIGANQDADKYGNLIYKKLKKLNYEVYPINPLYNDVDGDPCYPDISSLPKKPDVINMVVSPKRGRTYIEEAEKLGVKYVWLQPGTHDENLLSRIKELGLEEVQACVLVATISFQTEGFKD
jgi:uncharacterized protein